MWPDPFFFRFWRISLIDLKKDADWSHFWLKDWGVLVIHLGRLGIYFRTKM